MSAGQRLNLFRDYAQRLWGAMVGKIVLSTGIRCPNRESGGCLYCSAESFAPYYLDASRSLAEQLASGKEYLREIGAQLYFACFQQETSTAGPLPELLAKFRAPLPEPDCVGLTISTRPDCITPELLDALAVATQPFAAKPVILELGLQSARPATLLFLNRNHSVEDFARASGLIRQYPRFGLGAHLILGLPGETLEDMRHSLHFVASQGVGHLKLHHLQLVKGSRLAILDQTSPLRFPTVEEYLDWLCELIPHIPRSVIIHRFWGTSRRDLLLKPRWNLIPGQLFDRLARLLERRNIRQGDRV